MRRAFISNGDDRPAVAFRDSDGHNPPLPTAPTPRRQNRFFGEVGNVNLWRDHRRMEPKNLRVYDKMK